MKSLQDRHFEIDESYSLERLASDVLLFYIDRFRFALRIIKLNGSDREKWTRIVNLSDTDSSDDDPPFYGFVRECLDQSFQRLIAIDSVHSPVLQAISPIQKR